jgi:hypothetical protein
MAEMSKTARASMRQGQVVEKDHYDTNEKKIAEIRKLRAGKLFVTRMDFVDALLEEYDKAMVLLTPAPQPGDGNLSSECHSDLSAGAAIATGFLQAAKQSESEKLQADLEPLP